MTEKEILARYGIGPDSETVSEYAAIEEDEAGDVCHVLEDISDAIDAAKRAGEGQTLNPWFNDRQMEIINSYMDGQFGAELLTSREDSAKHAYACDPLLAHLLAACDSDHGETWVQRIFAISNEAQSPRCYRDKADLEARRQAPRP